MLFFVSCARGTEGALRKELVDLRVRAPRGEQGGVSFFGALEDALRVCLWSRVGMRVLLELGHFPAPDAEALYDGVRGLRWHEHLNATSTFAVTSAIRDTPSLTHSGFVALKVKDAIADNLRERFGRRPNVDVDNPDVSVFVHLAMREATVYLDLAGEPLHRRGYRVAMTEAPLKESLAAAVLTLGGADSQAPFWDPMCGSGTLLIEQALRARNMAPGLRRRFGFERWPSQAHAGAWRALRDEATAQALPRAPAPIVGGDVDPAAVSATRRNAKAAGVEADLRVEQTDLRGATSPEAPGVLCTNPPYGERLETDAAALHRLYDALGDVLDRHSAWRRVILAGNPQWIERYRQRAVIAHRLWNGPLEVRMFVYEAKARGAGAPTRSPIGA